MLVGVSQFDLGCGGIQIQTYNHISNSHHDYVIFADAPGCMEKDFKALPNVKEIVYCHDYQIPAEAEKREVAIFLHHTINHTVRKSIEGFDNIPVAVFHHCAWVPRYNASLVQGIITTSDYNFGLMYQNESFKGREIQKVHLSLNTALYDSILKDVKPEEIRKKWKIPAKAFVIGRVGRLEPGKCPEDAVVAAGNLKRCCNKKLFFIIAGALSTLQGPEYITSLKSLAEREGLTKKDILFTGEISEHDKIELLSTFDLYLYPTRYEGYCMAFLEAMYCQLPIVSYNNFANSETIEAGGICVPDGNINALVETAERLIDAVDERKKMGEAGKAIVSQRNGIKNFAEAVDTVLDMTYKHAQEKPALPPPAPPPPPEPEPIPEPDLVVVAPPPLNILQIAWGLVDEMESTPEHLQLVHLTRAGHTVQFFCTTSQGKNEVEGAKINRTTTFNPDLLTSKPDVVHLHHVDNPLSIQALKWAKEQCIPVVMNIHDWDSNLSNFGKVSQFIVFSQKEYDHRVKEIMAMGSQISLIPNGIDISRYTAETPQESSVFTVLFVGQLFGWKGINRVVLTAEWMRKYHPDKKINWQIVGHVRGEEQQLGAFIKAHGLEDIVQVFAASHGERKFSDLIKHYQGCDAFYLPTERDCYPTTILEAMACSKPVIATTVGGIANQIDHDVTGSHLYPPSGTIIEDAGSLISTLYTNKTLRERMGFAGRAKVERENDIRNTIQEYIKIYRRLSCNSQM